ncbi:hypothetical protein NLG97_g10797 [Lecanicillium saksenae]|uniref:Uncharacterized protein n=1 Tax=Lecanicillium saksenae TaxID=468837 RepID=A0ACC1QEM1_9HYPO|nr:hypothetical protein NLG97_g10797 [Lecanicillium saksenae]
MVCSNPLMRTPPAQSSRPRAVQLNPEEAGGAGENRADRHLVGISLRLLLFSLFMPSRSHSGLLLLVLVALRCKVPCGYSRSHTQFAPVLPLAADNAHAHSHACSPVSITGTTRTTRTTWLAPKPIPMPILIAAFPSSFLHPLDIPRAL